MTEKTAKIPLAEAAEITGVKARWLRDAIDCDELQAWDMSLGNQRPYWQVRLCDVEEYIASRKKKEPELIK